MYAEGTTQKKHSALLRALMLFLVLVFTFFQPAHAQENDENCLRFGGPFISIKGLTNGQGNFDIAMKDAGICATYIKYPMGRYSSALIEGRIDGIIFRVPSFGKVLGDAGFMVPEPVISGTALLVSFDPKITSLDALGDEHLGIRTGTVWTQKIVGSRKNVIGTNTYDSLIAMLLAKRVSAILVNSASAQLFKEQLKGATHTVIADLSVYVWLKSELKHRSDEIAAAIRAYHAKGRTFLDPLPGQ